MQIKELKTILDGSGIPFSYDHWAGSQSPEFPYGVYRTEETVPILADGAVAFSLLNITVSLWTKIKDPKAESKLETALSSADIFFRKEGTSYEYEENAYVTAYEIQIQED